MRAGVADYFSVVALSEVPRRELLDECLDAGAETPSITRLEGSRWHGGRLWSYKAGSTVLGRADSDDSGCGERRHKREGGRASQGWLGATGVQPGSRYTISET